MVSGSGFMLSLKLSRQETPASQNGHWSHPRQTQGGQPQVVRGLKGKKKTHCLFLLKMLEKSKQQKRSWMPQHLKPRTLLDQPSKMT